MTEQVYRYTESQLREALDQAAGSVHLPESLRRPAALVEGAGRKRFLGHWALGQALVGVLLAALVTGTLLLGGQRAASWLGQTPADPAPGEDLIIGENIIRGEAPWPSPELKLDYPVDTLAVTSPYGARQHPFASDSVGIHQGVDFAGEHGDPIRAVADGIVVSAEWRDQYGLLVILGHGPVEEAELNTWYAHLGAVHVEKGQHVSRGDLIAEMGSTGYTSGPHLHFEVRLDDSPVDPEPWFAKR